jgi:hypothetical protein
VFSLSISLVQVIAFSFATNFDELWGHLKGRIWALKSKWSHVFSSHMSTVLSLFKDKFYFDLCLTY